MLHAATVLEPLAKTAAGARIEGQIGGVAGERVLLVPPRADVEQARVDFLGRRAHRGVFQHFEAVVGRAHDRAARIIRSPEHRGGD